MDERSRYRGCLVGLAVGDAVGTTLEFTAPGSFIPITDMQGGGPFHLKPGQWTDDTSMALCLAASLLECGDFDAADQMQRYVRWWREGYLSSTGSCFDIGITVRTALQRFLETGDPLAGPTSESTAGNGSLMRLAPVVMRYGHNPEAAINYAAQSSLTTHGAKAAVDACRYMAGLIVGAFAGETKAVLLEPRYAPIARLWELEPLHPSIDEIAAGSFWQREPPTIVGSGYVVRSLEAALWAFARSESFAEGCLLAANLGNDADTTAAIYGQLAGAYYGLEGIPAHWCERLAEGEMIVDWADRLWAAGAPKTA